MAVKVRFLFAIMLCIANMIIYGLKVNISTTIIGMIKAKKIGDGGSINETVACPNFEVEGSSSVNIDGPYDWSTVEQGLVVSIYFAGYLVGMFPSGYFADRFNTKWVLLFCVLSNSLFTLMVPLAAPNLYVLYLLRFLTGLVSAANLPIVNVLVGKWVVYEEKSMWVAIIYGGTSIGTVISILTSGWIMNYSGWEMVFYVHGILPLIWCVVFAIFFAESPEAQKLISEEERELLVNSYGHRAPTSTKVQVPWKAIFTSVPFIALIFTNTLGNFCWYFLLTQMPLYMNKMLRFDIKSNATITCLPYLISSVTTTCLGKMLDWGRMKGWYSQTGARKTAVGISCVPVVVFLIIIMYIGCNRTVSVALLCLSIITCAALFVGHLTNQNDLAPNYAGILMGITNTPGTISAFVLPALVGHLVKDGHSFAAWQAVFWISIVCQLSAFAIFTIFGSAKIQPWNYPDGVIPPTR
ncbi:putative inorganic phosphate cotransporter [Phymastichus coffea]|uniref:putative inorganic phosphate cotransporter n=1 Tax=Phymastichus coffea TaxID=108790 RepID=UPI00273CB5F1|nr:putative inorganic phosphate cotransporter [Phymastichus coffea]XP_058803509.1 putative inorganic phosphate cotransporter [Phymastichus coffea]XP_058803510.1 putative inorganic phosphate cotransporter [Phymastichus coffea]XP_058803511.1 putative inorganic phosphate cotransporter [Phymastichus coffea]